MGNVHSREVVGRGSDAQLQVCEYSKKDNLAEKR